VARTHDRGHARPGRRPRRSSTRSPTRERSAPSVSWAWGPLPDCS
jgi:hypothetical protein